MKILKQRRLAYKGSGHAISVSNSIDQYLNKITTLRNNGSLGINGRELHKLYSFTQGLAYLMESNTEPK